MARPRNQPNPLVNPIPLTPAFKLIFISVLCLTVLSLVGAFVLVLLPHQTPGIERLANACSTTWQMGFGAIVGLIGGRALSA